MSGAMPWDTEPSRLEWTTEGVPFPMLIKRAGMGHLCGYVGLPEGHPLHGIPYIAVDVDVHGGLTFSGYLKGDGATWWLGFDCAHHGDMVPLIHAHTPQNFSEYRTIGWVRVETERLARQLVEVVS